MIESFMPAGFSQKDIRLAVAKCLLLLLFFLSAPLIAMAQTNPPRDRCISSYTELALRLPATITRTDIDNAAVGGIIGAWSYVGNPVTFRCNGGQISVVSASQLLSAGRQVTSPDGVTTAVYQTGVPGIGVAVVVRDPRRGWISVSGQENTLVAQANYPVLAIETKAVYVKTASVVRSGTIRATIADAFTRGGVRQETSSHLPLVLGETTVQPAVPKTCRIDHYSFELGRYRASELKEIGARSPARSLNVVAKCDNTSAVPIYYTVKPLSPIGASCDGMLGNLAETGSSNVGVYLSWNVNTTPKTCFNEEEAVPPSSLSSGTNSMFTLELRAGIAQLTGRGYVGPVRASAILSAYYN